MKRKRDQGEEHDAVISKKQKYEEPSSISIQAEWEAFCAEKETKHKKIQDLKRQLEALQADDPQETSKEASLRLRAAGGQLLLEALFPFGVNKDVIGLILEYASSIQNLVAWRTARLDLDSFNESTDSSWHNTRHLSMCVVGDEVVIANSEGFVGVMSTAATRGDDATMLRHSLPTQKAFDVENTGLFMKGVKDNIFLMSTSPTDRNIWRLNRRTLECSKNTLESEDVDSMHVDSWDELWLRESVSILVNQKRPDQKIAFDETEEILTVCNCQTASGGAALLLLVDQDTDEQEEDFSLFFVSLEVEQPCPTRTYIGTLPRNTFRMGALGDQLFFLTDHLEEHTGLFECTLDLEKASISDPKKLQVFRDKRSVSFCVHPSSPSDPVASLWLLLQRWKDCGPYELLKLF